MNLLPEQIKMAAVGIVEGYINDKVELTDGVVKYASCNDLNPEQVKRVVEATNQIAYLKLLKEAEDRTFEFPLADYTSAMDKILTPVVHQEKQASVASQTLSPMQIVAGTGLEKKASQEYVYECSEQELLTRMNKAFWAGVGTLEKMASDKEILAIDLDRQLQLCAKDPEFMEKFALVSAEEEYEAIKGHIKQASEPFTKLYSEAELGEARKTANMLKQAAKMIEEFNSLNEALSKTASVLKEKAGITELENYLHEKTAFSVAGGASYLLGKTLGWSGRAATGAAIKVGKATAKGTIGLATAGKGSVAVGILGASQVRSPNNVYKDLHG